MSNKFSNISLKFILSAVSGGLAYNAYHKHETFSLKASLFFFAMVGFFMIGFYNLKKDQGIKVKFKK
ncbi:hypothetical protein H9X96_20625 [Pedobacter sp. N36a]|uniref:hypothetical protein n=1 Tax=Pedobacter sp. N36a TaxID=2767996 RepID=UPI0016573C89|nr:hypothetical protein [Pedobacter sp. N36a]MBC8988166.1 hypothetical protein [Pedobacter sp. N36a]